MPLNAEQKKRMDKLDFSMGGGYSDFLTDMNKAAPSDSKFLFVGLGGKGSSVVAGLKTEVYKRIQCPNNKFKPDNFEYLAIDTSTDDLRRLTNGAFGQIGLSEEPQDSEIFSLFDAGLAEILAGRNGERPDNIAEWMNPSLTPALAGEGAGGIRQAGRGLLFGGKCQELWTVLRNKLQKLHDQIVNSQREKLIVYVFAGIGGGTGSGTIIDIPYIVKEVANRNHWAIDVNGYIFLPDTYDPNANIPQLEKNSYAALQEIDSLMALSYMDGAGRFHAEYAPGYSVDSTESIFHACVLISGKRGNGLVPNPDRFSKRVVIDNIVNLVSKTTDIQQGNMLVNSFLDNNPASINLKVAPLPTIVPRDKHFQYLALGIGAVELPMDQMMAYLAKGTFDKMRVGWNQHASAADVAQELKNLNTKADDLAGEILQGATKPLFSYNKTLMDALEPYKNKTSIENGQFFAKVKAIWMGYRTEMLSQWDTSAERCTARVVSAFEQKYTQMFQHPQYGIYYLKELLSWRVVDNKSFNGIRECIYSGYYSTQMEGLIRGAEESELAAAEEKRLIGEHGAFLFPYEKYCKACVAELVKKDIQYLYDHYVRKCLEELILNIDEKIKNLQEYVDIFTYLEAIVTKNYNTAMDGNMPHAEYASVLLDFSKRNDPTDPSVDRVINMLDSMLAQKSGAGLVTVLESNILNTEEAWLHSTEKFNPVKVFVEFLENQFTEMQTYTLDSFLQLKYDATGLGQAITTLCQQLQTSAGVTFPSIPQLPLSSLLCNNYVVVPAGNSAVSQGIISFSAHVPNVQQAQSTDRNRIYWYNLVAGIPAFALSDIHNYERVYKERVNLPEKGLHLFESDKMDWRKDLPLLDSSALWPATYYDSVEMEYVQAGQEQVQKFIKIGLIQTKQVAGTTQYVAYGFDESTMDHGTDKILNWCKDIYLENPVWTEEGLLDSSAGFVNTLFDRLTESVFNMQEFYIQNDAMMFVIDNKEKLYKAMRLQSFLYKRLQGTYEICKKCIDMIEAKNAELREEKEQKVNLELFANYMRRGIIRTDDQAAFYVDSEGKQGVLLYYNMISPSMKLPFKTYYVFEKFSKLDAELKANLAQYYESLLVQENEDASLRAEFSKNRDLIKADVQQAQTILNQYTTRKNFADIGEGDLPDKYDEFYRKLDLLS